jgi:peptidoglycan/xylan/chitin deacetylase (PgdA/CDA1 family)
MIALAAALVGVAALLVLHLELNLFGRAPRRALRVLMYHRIGDHPGRDTVAAAELDRQIGWLAAHGYDFVRLSDVVAHRRGAPLPAPLPKKPVLLTFDDGTRDHFEELLPILRRRGVPAALFVVPGFAGQELDYGGRRTPFASVEMLRELVEAGAQLGLHTYSHRDLAAASPAEVEEELRRSFEFFAAHRLPVEPALAYPFGAYPRREPAERQAFFAALRRAGVELAFRIGNRVNPLPLATDFEVQRTGVRRSDRLWSFAIKVRKGRRKAFA